MTDLFRKRQIITGYLCAIGATAIWSGNFIIARGLNESIPPVSLAFWRWVVAVIAFLPFALKPMISEWATLKRHLTYLSITSVLGVTIFNTLVYIAGHTTTAINLSLIAITFPVFIVILSRFLFHELITFNKAFGVLLVATGVVLLITKGDLSRLSNISFAVGDLWMLIAAMIFAVFSILLKHKPRQLSLWAFQSSTFILGLIFLFPFYIWEYATTPPIELDAMTVGAILYVGLFASLSAFILWNKAILAVGPSNAGMIYYTLPLFSGLLAYLFLNENIGALHFASALLIVSGILTANHKSKNTPVGKG